MIRTLVATKRAVAASQLIHSSSLTVATLARSLSLSTNNSTTFPAAAFAARLPRFFSSSSSSDISSLTDDNDYDNIDFLPSDKLYMWGTDDSKASTTLLKNARYQDTAVLDRPTRVHHVVERMSDAENTTDTDDNVTIKEVVCGPHDTAFLLSDGTCRVMGLNKNGMLGVGHAQPVTNTPVTVHVPSEDSSHSNQITQVSLGPQSAAFVDAAGDLYTCGFAGSTLGGGLGLLGLGHAQETAAATTTPQLVTSLVHDGCRVQQVQVSEEHMTVLTTEGEVLTTGAASYGRLGNFTTDQDQWYLEPVEMLGPASQVTHIAGGKSFTLAQCRDGSVYSWGRNHKGQLGTGLGLAVDIYAMQSVPEPLSELEGRIVVQIAAGHSHAAALTDKGELWVWGMSLHFDPVLVHELLPHKIVHVACGQDYTLAVDADGNLYSLGIATKGAFRGTSGVLAQGPEVKRLNQAQAVEFPDDTVKVRQVSAGWKHAACLVE